MANFKTYITEHGWKTLLNSGLLKTITSFKVGDDTLIYGIEENNIKPAFYDYTITGNRNGTTTIPSCSLADKTPVPLNPPQPEEIKNLDSRIKLAFVSEDCSIPFEKNNLTVRVNVDKWIDDLLNLKSSSYSKTSSGLKIKIWDYIIGYLEEYNNGTKVWDNKEDYTSNLDIYYKLLSEKDQTIYNLVSPKYMMVTKDGKKVFNNGQTKTRFASNMILTFNTKTINGVDVFGTSNTLGLYPDSWGYVADSTYLRSGDVENTINANPGAYKTIYPALEIDNKIYQLKEDKNYTSKDGVEYMVRGYKDDDGNPAIDGLTDKLKLFMKANGEEVESGVYRMVINFMVGLKSGKEFNRAYQNKKIGGELTYELYYNENTVSTDLYTIS